MNTKVVSEERKTISLVLGSGGARGLAHIGIIQVLQEQGYQIKSIAGCSAGAVVGGVFAAGKLDEFEQWLRAIDKYDIFTLLDFSFSGGGLVKGDKIINTLKGLLGEHRIENLPIPFTAVAADIKNGKEVWLNKGSLFDAIRASMSLPLFFTPVKYNDGYLIDGGVLNPVPIAPTFSDKTDLTIAVNLGGEVTHYTETEQIEERKEEQQYAASKREKMDGNTPFHQDIMTFIKKLQDSDEDGGTEAGRKKAKSKDWGFYEVANQAFDTMQSTVARQKLAAYPPDLEIKVPRNVAGILDLHRADELIALGKKVAVEALKKA